jgi:hypothetical protein
MEIRGEAAAFAVLVGSRCPPRGQGLILWPPSAGCRRSGMSLAAPVLAFLGALNAYLWPVLCVLSLVLLPFHRKKEPS